MTSKRRNFLALVFINLAEISPTNILKKSQIFVKKGDFSYFYLTYFSSKNTVCGISKNPELEKYIILEEVENLTAQ